MDDIDSDRVLFRTHAIERMFQRSIDEEDVYHVLEEGEVIENYPDDQPYPSQLILGWSDDRPIHVVVARNNDDNQLIVITVYEPDADDWHDDFKRRNE
jgi:hypothetical protein